MLFLFYFDYNCIFPGIDTVTYGQENYFTVLMSEHGSGNAGATNVIRVLG